ncbi:tyrosine-type recombinase/integrase [Zobellella maritima]
MNALAFLYHQVLKIELGELGFQPAKQHRRLPVVLTREEVKLIFDKLDNHYRLIFSLLYGSGLRITECLRLRIQDIGFNDGSITVRNGKGNKDRKTILSRSLYPALQEQVEHVLAIQQADNRQGVGPSLPHALGKKYPNAFRQRAAISERCRSCWATAMYAQPRSTRMSLASTLPAPAVPLIISDIAVLPSHQARYRPDLAGDLASCLPLV